MIVCKYTGNPILQRSSKALSKQGKMWELDTLFLNQAKYQPGRYYNWSTHSNTCLQSNIMCGKQIRNNEIKHVKPINKQQKQYK